MRLTRLGVTVNKTSKRAISVSWLEGNTSPAEKQSRHPLAPAATATRPVTHLAIFIRSVNEQGDSSHSLGALV